MVGKKGLGYPEMIYILLILLALGLIYVVISRWKF